MQNEKIRGKLEIIRETSKDMIAQIGVILQKNDKIDIASMKTGAYEKDLFRLMKDAAEVANPILEDMGLGKEAIEADIEEFVKILEDNQQEVYFASVNIDGKYSRSIYVLTNVRTWLERLCNALEKIEEFLDTESEEAELKKLYGMLDAAKLPEKTRDEIKQEFLRVLNEFRSAKK